MGVGLPFQGVIWFRGENNYGGATMTPMPISSKVLDVRLDSGPAFKKIIGISEPSYCAYISQPSDPTLHVEWVLQPSASVSFASYCVTRTSAGDLNSMEIEFGTNTWGTTKSYWICKGCKCKTFKVSGSLKNEIVCSADFSVMSVTSASTTTVTTPVNMTSDLAVFNGGVITGTGKAWNFYVTDSFEINLNNNLKDYWDVDSLTKVAAIPGAKDITGTSDISLDDGGAGHWGTVTLNLTEFTTIAFSTSRTGLDDTFTLKNVRFDDTSIDVNTSGDMMKTSQKFTAKDLTIA